MEALAGKIIRNGDNVTVRIENIKILESLRGESGSLPGVINRLKSIASGGGASKLTIEGVSVGNDALARILVKRYGAQFTPQRSLIFDIPLN